MRVAVVNWTSRRVGGIETYLDTTLPGLGERRHDVAFVHEMDRPEDHDRITLPDESQTWCVEELGASAAVEGLRTWRPHAIYLHGCVDPRLESEITSVAPSVFFAHQYDGTCVGGPKTWKYPTVVPCALSFGARCLLHYYPHRCGGWSPVTMLRQYNRQRWRLHQLRSYRAIVTHTDHMRREYLKHGFPETRVHRLPFPVAGAETTNSRQKRRALKERDIYTLLFLGRMDRLKGGDVLIDAAQHAATALPHPLRLVFAGEGPMRANWEKKAARAMRSHGNLQISSKGWVNASERSRLFSDADLLVLPSLWPEPFGMVGVEAGLLGVPSVGFAVGGIPEWLHDGQNGHLAPGDPPTTAGLSQAIVACLENQEHYESLCAGAFTVSRGYTLSRHLEALDAVFERAIEERQP